MLVRFWFNQFIGFESDFFFIIGLRELSPYPFYLAAILIACCTVAVASLRLSELLVNFGLSVFSVSIWVTLRSGGVKSFSTRSLH
jgi:hypothetical protein